MLCDFCNKNEASNHIKQIVNDKITIMHLCNECAAKHGYNDLLGFGLNSFLGTMFDFPLASASLRREDDTVCPSCGQRFSDITRRGKVGCADCYDTFCDKIAPSIKRIHGDTSHVGKIPISAGKKARRKAEIEGLQRKMNKAVELQEFEKAAQYRDRIKELEGEDDE